jgi:putative membrane protein
MLVKLILNCITLYLTTKLISGIKIKGTFPVLAMVIMISVLNILVRPLLFIFTLPATILTFGLFIFILNGIIFYWAAKIVKDFEVKDIWAGVIGWIIYSIFSLIFQTFFII